MNTCTHEDYEPVETGGGFGSPFELFATTPVVVAHICTDCREQLPAWWGCEDCETYEGARQLSEYVPKVYLARPCRRHQEAL